jgi:hypothetical protein
LPKVIPVNQVPIKTPEPFVPLQFPPPPPKMLPVKPRIANEIAEDFVSLPTPPPLPSFIPALNFPKVIPVKPAPQPIDINAAQIPDASLVLSSFAEIPSFPKMAPLVVSTPSSFVPAPLPVKPVEIPQIQPRIFEATTKSPNEYLPPIDVRINDMPDWLTWKVKQFSFIHKTTY